MKAPVLRTLRVICHEGPGDYIMGGLVILVMFVLPYVTYVCCITAAQRGQACLFFKERRILSEDTPWIWCVRIIYHFCCVQPCLIASHTPFCVFTQFCFTHTHTNTHTHSLTTNIRTCTYRHTQCTRARTQTKTQAHVQAQAQTRTQTQTDIRRTKRHRQGTHDVQKRKQEQKK